MKLLRRTIPPVALLLLFVTSCGDSDSSAMSWLDVAMGNDTVELGDDGTSGAIDTMAGQDTVPLGDLSSEPAEDTMDPSPDGGGGVDMDADQGTTGEVTGAEIVDPDQEIIEPPTPPDDAIFVDSGAEGTGSGAKTDPYASFDEAMAMAEPGDTIYLMAGQYDTTLVVTKPVTIMGAGADLTAIVPGPSAVGIIVHNLEGVGIEHLAIQGALTGVDGLRSDLTVSHVALEGIQAEGIIVHNCTAVLDDLSILDPMAVGIIVHNSEATITHTSIEHPGEVGIIVHNADNPLSMVSSQGIIVHNLEAVLDDVDIIGPMANGIIVHNATATMSTVEVTGAVATTDRLSGTGILADGGSSLDLSYVTATDNDLHGILMTDAKGIIVHNTVTLNGSAGLAIQGVVQGEKIMILDSTFEDNGGPGVLLSHTNAELDTVTLQNNGSFGATVIESKAIIVHNTVVLNALGGLYFGGMLDPSMVMSAGIDDTEIVGNVSAGIMVDGAAVEVLGSLVKDTTLDGEGHGDGVVAVSTGAFETPTAITLDTVTVTGSGRAGILLDGAATQGIIVHNTVTTNGAAGIWIQHNAFGDIQGTTHIDGNKLVGIGVVLEGMVNVVGIDISGTTALDEADAMGSGDGIAVMTQGGGQILDNTISSNGRAGILIDDADSDHLQVQANTISGNAFGVVVQDMTDITWLAETYLSDNTLDDNDADGVTTPASGSPEELADYSTFMGD